MPIPAPRVWRRPAGPRIGTLPLRSCSAKASSVARIWQRSTLVPRQLRAPRPDFTQRKETRSLQRGAWFSFWMGKYSATAIAKGGWNVKTGFDSVIRAIQSDISHSNGEWCVRPQFALRNQRTTGIQFGRGSRSSRTADTSHCEQQTPAIRARTPVVPRDVV